MENYRVQSPVLLLLFNRPDLTQQVFQQIQRVQPARLYIAADGPRPTHAADAALCAQARAVATQVNWDCTVKTLFREANKGCKKAVSEALTWFFEQEPEGIILEDDCLPVQSFFYFCDTLLQHYRLDTRITCITGTNLQNGRQWGDASYYFSRYSNIWGWASWRRVWQQYDAELTQYQPAEVARQMKKVFSDPFLAADWVKLFNDLKAGLIDTWDYQLNFINFFENRLCVTPNVNLISNTGFRDDATHTHNPDNHNAHLPAGEITHITHPRYFLPETEADYYFLQKEFDLAARWRRYNKPKRKFKRWVRALFQST
ncbi:nucleotide-diphospho-sugar transferase [Deminuibacter soli]|uniref:Nucleotide-diphospho-sugar transferase n=1 Tax=Deminuibacter soli TaxID=2291815 RepID=A0A3E1NIY9_9BACT|nr:nucleotide-diphospho-sugar transferase [Deminuibacter soli]RFM27903.1 nucleotide-diphospho-sugar transferase [Deminuibacter soli]